MVDLKKLRDLVKLMVDNELTELDLQGEGERITLKRGGHDKVVHVAPPMPSAAFPAPASASAPAAAAAPADEFAGLTPIRSPMVGTFYSSPSPDAPPFAGVGQAIGPESVICLIEAMKVFNEIKAETSGVVEKVFVQNGQAVEFDQPLFLIRPQ